jgi:ABC-type transporter Mla subunit MlaD
MVDPTLLTVLIVFVALCALSQLGQCLALVGLYRKVQSIQEEARPLLSKATETLDAAKATIDDGRKQMQEISKRTNQILDSTQSQLAKIDAVVTDASERAMVQLDRVEMVVGGTVEKVQGLVNTTQEGLMKPLREVSALVTGVKGAFGFLFKTRRPSVVHATQDEEMFI